MRLLCLLAAAALATAGPVPHGSLGGFLTLDEAHAHLQRLAQRAPREMTYPVDIGTSFEGRPLRAACLGRCQDQDQDKEAPAALFTGLHHAREPMTLSVLVALAQHLVEGLEVEDPEVRALLASRALWLVPVVNPDGYAWNERDRLAGGKGERRKNGRSGDGACKQAANAGVDLNRNYGYCFDKQPRGREEAGASRRPCDEDYEGPAAFSEPETQALRALVEAHSFSVALNYHSFGGMYNIPFACARSAEPAEMDAFVALARAMKAASGYNYGHAASLLYSVSGEASDWMFAEHRVLAISPETGPSDRQLGRREDGFWPAERRIDPVCLENLGANLEAAWRAGPSLQLAVAKGGGVEVTNVGRRATDGPLTIASGELRELGVLEPGQTAAVDALRAVGQIVVWDATVCTLFGLDGERKWSDTVSACSGYASVAGSSLGSGSGSAPASAPAPAAVPVADAATEVECEEVREQLQLLGEEPAAAIGFSRVLGWGLALVGGVLVGGRVGRAAFGRGGVKYQRVPTADVP